MNKEAYMKLPYDLSGAMSKNRFKNEILWGVHKILELYTSEDNFNVIFDYVCDIEVHWKNDECEFYQVKTSNSGGAYTQTKLTSIGNKENSVLAKLYILKERFEGDKNKVKLAIVSNKPFRDKNGKLYNTAENLEFNSLDDDTKIQVENSLKEELNLESVDINNINFIYTSIDLLHPKHTLTGELVNFFNDTLKVEIKKPTVLYEMLVDEISEKAEFEMKSDTYDELIKNKAISKDRIKELFTKHMQISDISVEKTNMNIEKIYSENYGEKLRMKTALASIVSKLSDSKELQKMEQEIIEFIDNNISILESDLKTVINNLYQIYKDNFNIEYSDYEIKSFILLVLMKREEKKYE